MKNLILYGADNVVLRTERKIKRKRGIEKIYIHLYIVTASVV
jgi:hypothetical protein